MITFAEPIDLDALRIRHEFLALPDLRVSVDAVGALLHVTSRHARLILESLVREGFLERGADGQYVRSTAAPSYRPASRATV
jgi:predicted transcriptional regulator of viral defense system